jgi:hypothetical protein
MWSNITYTYPRIQEVTFFMGTKVEEGVTAGKTALTHTTHAPAHTRRSKTAITCILTHCFLVVWL